MHVLPFISFSVPPIQKSLNFLSSSVHTDQYIYIYIYIYIYYINIYI